MDIRHYNKDEYEKWFQALSGANQNKVRRNLDRLRETDRVNLHLLPVKPIKDAKSVYELKIEPIRIMFGASRELAVLLTYVVKAGEQVHLRAIDLAKKRWKELTE